MATQDKVPAKVIPKRGAAAKDDGSEDESQQDGAGNVTQAQGQPDGSTGNTEQNTADKASDASQAEPSAEELAHREAEAKEKARLAEVEAKIKAAEKNRAPAPLDDMKAAQLAQAYVDGPRFIMAGKMTMDQAIRDLSTAFGQVPADVRAKLEAGIAAAKAADAKLVEDEEDKVLVNVPRAFKLRMPGNKVIQINKGPQRMPRSQAMHWYSKNNGVTIA